MSAQLQQLFEYLLAVKNMISPPIRDFRQYDYATYIEDLPKGCYLYGTGKDKEAWVEVSKPIFMPPPKPDSSFAKWLKTDYHDELKEPDVYEEMEWPIEPDNDHLDSSKHTFVETFESNKTRVKEYEIWLEKWYEWSEDTQSKKAIQQIYEELFSLFQRLERDREACEFALGQGILTWKQSDKTLIHPLIITRIELSFDPYRGKFALVPVQGTTVCEMDMLDGIELPNSNYLNNLRREINASNMDPHSQEAITSYFIQFIHLLDPNGKLEHVSEKITVEEQPVIYNQQVLFLRKKSGHLWKEELENAISALQKGYEIPNTLKAIVDPESVENNQSTNHTLPQLESDHRPNSEDRSTHISKHDLLFPLPSNDVQQEIAKRLNDNDGVTVQGPPGTGKSHTIANLISDLLAKGKRVLVTSQKERALRVLTEKLPQDIRSLCVSLSGGDLRSLQEIENSIRSISFQTEHLNADKLMRDITVLKSEWEGVKDDIDDLKHQLQQVAEKEQQQLHWDGEMISRIEAAKWLKETEDELGWIPDQVPLYRKLPLTEDEMKGFWKLRETLTMEDKPIIYQHLPQPAQLLSPQKFKAWVEEGRDLEGEVDQTIDKVQSAGYPISSAFLTQLKKHVNKIMQCSLPLKVPYLIPVLEDYFSTEERQKKWDSFVVYSRVMIERINRLKQRISDFQFFTHEKPYDVFKKDVSSLEARLKTHKKISTFYLLISGRKQKYLVKQPVINDRGIQTLADIELVKTYIDFEESKEKFVRKWNATFVEIGGPIISFDNQRLFSIVDDCLFHIEAAKTLARHINDLKGFLSTNTYYLSKPVSWNSIETYKELEGDLKILQHHIQFKDWELFYQETLHQLIEYADEPDSHPIWVEVIEAFKHLDIAQWSTLCQKIQQLLQLQADYKTFIQLIERIEKSAPRLAYELQGTLGKPLPYPENWREAWKWSQINAWYHDTELQSADTIKRKIEEKERQEKEVITKLITKSAWRNQILRMTEQQKRALQAWKQKIKRIGKGTGRYADQLRKEAQQEMNVCRTAIPAWIMPIDRVIETMPLSNDQFDVVIIDESSQSDLFTLSVLMRAKKAVIVGDDEQISPSAVGVNQEEVRSLIRRYLHDIPQSHSFDMQTSLYDVAQRTFPGRLMLKEHFRCAPEIIQFSNQLSYNGEIVPLTSSNNEDRIHPTVMAKKVNGYREGGTKAVNKVEAKAIVDDIKAVIKDKKYTNLTIGVISLQGKEQSELIETLIRRELPEKEIVDRKIMCGDAYTFQGDERDIMFMSMVVGNNTRFAPLVKKDAQQRYNVAVSRAKKQLRLYHSIELTDLNVKDLRFRLLEYCLNPVPAVGPKRDLEAISLSPLLQDVAQSLIDDGYKVHPLYEVSQLSIDLVIEGTQDRMAIKCIGEEQYGKDLWDEEMEKIRVLERSGWKFYFLIGSEFYRYPEKTMNHLRKALDEAGIFNDSPTNKAVNQKVIQFADLK